MSDIEDIRRNFDGKPAWTGTPDKQKRKSSRERHGSKTQYPERKKQPPAKVWSSVIAQQWVDLGTGHGLEFPFDANFFALALERKVEKDPVFRKIDDDPDKVQRWLAKMVERWWAEYVDNQVYAANAMNFFLVTDWRDLQEYARSCLRAAYLKEHGRRIEHDLVPPEGVTAEEDPQQQYLARLEKVRKDAQVKEWMQRVDAAPEREELDESHRERLRSWADKRRKK